MDAAVYDNFLAIMDDALTLAKEAVATAERAERSSLPAPQVMLTKVAHSKCASAAKVLHRTGTFRQQSEADLARSLENAGETGLIEMMEKLASSAVFPISDVYVPDGDLVEKSAANGAYAHLPAKTAVWRQALDEAEDEL